MYCTRVWLINRCRKFRDPIRKQYLIAGVAPQCCYWIGFQSASKGVLYRPHRAEKAKIALHYRARVWGLVQAGNTVSFPDIRQVRSTGGVNRAVVQNKFVSGLQQSLDHLILEHFTELVREELLTLDKSVVQDTLRLTFVQSGYVRGGFVPTLHDCETVDGNPVITERSPLTGVRQRVFGIGWESENQRKKQSFVEMRTEDGDKKLVWVWKVLLLCRLTSSTVQDIGEYAFVQYMEVSKAVSGVDEALGCVCLR